MITAEQARQNVERHKVQVAEQKQKIAEEFIGKVVEPAIREASMQGKSEMTLNIGECMEAASEVVGIINASGFKTERSRNDSAIRVSWYGSGEVTPRNTRVAVILP